MKYAWLLFFEQLALYAFIEARDANDHPLMAAATNRFEFVARHDVEGDRPAFDARYLRCGYHTQADRCRRGMTDIEPNAEALVASGKKVLDGGERRGFDDIDHNRGCQYGDPSRSDEGRCMLRADDDFGCAGEAGHDLAEDSAAGTV